MVAATLKFASHQVTDLANRRLARNKAKAGKFDAVVTDLNMPVMN